MDLLLSMVALAQSDKAANTRPSNNCGRDIFLIVGVTWAAQTAIRRASLRLSKCSTLKITLTRFMQPDLQNLLGSLEKFHQYECHKPRHAVARGDEVT